MADKSIRGQLARLKIGRGVQNLSLVGFVFAAFGFMGAGAALLRLLPPDAPLSEAVSRLSLSNWFGGATCLIAGLLMCGCFLMFIGAKIGRFWVMWSCLMFALLTLSQAYFATRAYLDSKPGIQNFWAFILPVAEITGDAVLHAAFPFMLGVLLTHPAIRGKAEA